jgi:hypothetical protein
MSVMESKIRSRHYQMRRRYGGSPHDESIAKFQEEPEHADDEDATVRRAKVVGATEPEGRRQKGLYEQGRSYDPTPTLCTQRFPLSAHAGAPSLVSYLSTIRRGSTPLHGMLHHFINSRVSPSL